MMLKHRLFLVLALGAIGSQTTACGVKNAETLKRVVGDFQAGSESKSDQGSSVKDESTEEKSTSQDSKVTSIDKQEEKQIVDPQVPPKTDLISSEASSRLALNSCIKAWNGKAPFNDKSPYRLIMPGVMVFGIGVAVNDTQTTAAPELVLIPAGVNVLGTASYRLLNPNAWYCLVTTVNVLGTLNIEINAKAQLADSSVDIMVAGKQSASATGFVTVNVGGGISLKVVQ